MSPTLNDLVAKTPIPFPEISLNSNLSSILVSLIPKDEPCQASVNGSTSRITFFRFDPHKMLYRVNQRYLMIWNTFHKRQRPQVTQHRIGPDFPIYYTCPAPI